MFKAIPGYNLKHVRIKRIHFIHVNINLVLKWFAWEFIMTILCNTKRGRYKIYLSHDKQKERLLYNYDYVISKTFHNLEFPLIMFCQSFCETI